MWCKRYFEQEFPDSQCRLFSTQNLLFQFLDSLPLSGLSSSPSWLPFSIELHSEDEVSQHLSLGRYYGERRSGTENNTSSIFQFRKRSSSNNERGAENDSLMVCTTREFQHKRPRREAFCLLYGDESLSCQTRFFLACTTEGLKGMILKMAPAGDLHLYEIIRENAPCHLYFDVECEGNIDVTVPCVSVDDIGEEESETQECTPYFSYDSHRRIVLPASCANPEIFLTALPTTPSSSPTRDPRRKSSEVCTVLQYYEWAKLVPAAEYPPGCCPVSCPCLLPSTKQTTEVLLHALYDFIQEYYPQIFQGILFDPPLPHDKGNKGDVDINSFWKIGKDDLGGGALLKEKNEKCHRLSSSITSPLVHHQEEPGSGGAAVLPPHYRCWKKIVVLESKKIPEKEAKDQGNVLYSSPKKFSQHYVLQMYDNRVWENNKVVGEFVKHFVEYLQQRIASIPVSAHAASLEPHSSALSLHSALFFHSEVKMWSVRLRQDLLSLYSSPCCRSHSGVEGAHEQEVESLSSSARAIPPHVISLPFLVRKCFIDTAVYSKNRIMRCLYSSKLHKPYMFQIEQEIRCGRRVMSASPDAFTVSPRFGEFPGQMLSSSTTREEEEADDVTLLRKLGALLNSLISVSITHFSFTSLLPSGESETQKESLIALQETTNQEEQVEVSGKEDKKCRDSMKKMQKRIYLSPPSACMLQGREWKITQRSGLVLPGKENMEGEEPPASVLALIEQQYSTLSGKPCLLAQKPYRKGGFLLYTVGGTRYCQNVKREHKSNNVYIVVDMLKKVWAQKCFDPDCSTFRGPSISF